MTDVTRTPMWMRVIGGLLVASFGGFVALTLFLAGQIGSGPAVLTMAPGVLVLVVGLLLITASVRVNVADQIDLRFYPIWHRSIAFADVETAKVEGSSWVRFGGFGLRWRPGGTGLIIGNMPAAVIITRAGHEYVVQCADPDAVVAAIRQRMNARGTPE